MTKFNKAFKSKIDQFLEDFDKHHPNRSLSQQKEVREYKKISQLRDIATA